MILCADMIDDADCSDDHATTSASCSDSGSRSGSMSSQVTGKLSTERFLLLLLQQKYHFLFIHSHLSRFYLASVATLS